MSRWTDRSDARRARRTRPKSTVMETVGEAAGEVVGGVADGMGGCAEGCGGCATAVLLGVPLGAYAVWQGLSLLA